MSGSWLRGHGFDSRLAQCQATTFGKLLTPMCLCHQAVQFGTSQSVVMLCGREGNRMSDISGLSTYGLTATKHPTYASTWSMVHFTFIGTVLTHMIRDKKKKRHNVCSKTDACLLSPLHIMEKCKSNGCQHPIVERTCAACCAVTGWRRISHKLQMIQMATY